MTEQPEQNETKNITQEEIDRIKTEIEQSFKDIDINSPEELIKYLQNNYNLDIPDLERPKKLIECPHEIIFDVKATVLEENEKGEIVGCKEICRKDYHIPVPPTADYNYYMESFFQYLENCITSSAKHAANKTEDNNG